MNAQIKLVVVHFIFAIQCVLPVDWCNIASCDTPELHIMCKYKDEVNDAHCSKLAVSSEETFKSTLLNAHNKFRNQWANKEILPTFPKVADMLKMTWDEELQMLAERNGKNCLQDHDKCRDTENLLVGQNIGLTFATHDPGSSEEIFHNWIRESNFFHKNNIEFFTPGTQRIEIWDKKILARPLSRMYISPVSVTRFKRQLGTTVPENGEEKGYGHFTQCIWSRSKRLGCSEVTFFDQTRHMNARYIICNYGPAGNMYHDYVFKSGEPCTACPNGTSCDDEFYPYLCAGQNPVVQQHKMSGLIIPLMVMSSLWMTKFCAEVC